MPETLDETMPAPDEEDGMLHAGQKFIYADATPTLGDMLRLGREVLAYEGAKQDEAG